MQALLVLHFALSVPCIIIITTTEPLLLQLQFLNICCCCRRRLCVDAAALLHSLSLVSRSTRLQMHLVMCIYVLAGDKRPRYKNESGVCWFVLFIAVHHVRVPPCSANQMYFMANLSPSPPTTIKRTREVSRAFHLGDEFPLHLSSFMLTAFALLPLRARVPSLQLEAQGLLFSFLNFWIHLWQY